MGILEFLVQGGSVFPFRVVIVMQPTDKIERLKLDFDLYVPVQASPRAVCRGRKPT